MVCYSDRVRAFSQSFMKCSFLALGVLGIVSAVYGTVTMGIIQKPNAWTGVSELNNQVLGIAVLIFGILNILLGIFAFCVQSCKKPFISGIFIILAFIIGLAMLIVGFVVMGGASEFVDKTQKDVCGLADSATSKLAENYNKAVQQYVCTDACPCYAGADGTTKTLWGTYEESLFTEWGRTNAPKVEGAENANAPMVWLEVEAGTFSSWKQCYNEVLKK